MRVGIISDFYPLYGAKAVKKIVLALEREGHSAVLLTSNRLQDGSCLTAGVHRLGERSTIVRIPSPLLFLNASPLVFPLGLPLLANRIFKANDVEIVHIHFLASYSFQVYALLSKLRKRYPIVATPHGVVSGYNAPALKAVATGIRMMSRLSLSAVDRFSVVSKLTAPFLQFLGVSPNKIQYIPNGVDTTLFTRYDRRKSESNLGLESSSRVRVLFFAHLRKSKGVDLFLDMAENIAGKRDDVEFVVIGSGPLEKMVQQRCKGVPHRIKHISYIDDSLLPSAYSSADVYVLPSYVEGLPQSLLEAMACGTICIASDVGGVSELFPDQLKQLLIESGDLKALTWTVETIIDNADLRSRLSSQQERHVKTFYSLSRVTRASIALYKSTLQGM